MGCGCGGSGAVSPGTPGALTGPNAPGYAWTGPQKRAVVEKKKQAAKPAKSE